MSTKDAAKVLSAPARVFLSLAFLLSQTASAAQAQNTKQNFESARKGNSQAAPVKESASKLAKTDTEETESANQSTAGESTSGGGPHEGIKVHGHWIIEVRNLDGTLVTHREFENSLFQPSGAQLLIGLLNSLGQASSLTSSSWALVLTGTPGPCGAQPSCLIIQPGVNLAADSANLTSNANVGSFVLSGSVTASASSSIGSVQTAAILFKGTAFNRSTFTATTLSTPVSVVANQIIQVTVVISFS